MNNIHEPIPFRNGLAPFIDKSPELFPNGIKEGYRMKEMRVSKKNRDTNTQNSCGWCLLHHQGSYHVGFSADVEKALFLRKLDVPFWALKNVFGKDAMFWYRMEQTLARNSIIGTTIKDPDLLPEHLAADEKHSRLKGSKIYIAPTVGENCILGASRIHKNS